MSVRIKNMTGEGLCINIGKGCHLGPYELSQEEFAPVEIARLPNVVKLKERGAITLVVIPPVIKDAPETLDKMLEKHLEVLKVEETEFEKQLGALKAKEAEFEERIKAVKAKGMELENQLKAELDKQFKDLEEKDCLLYTSPSPRD